MEEIILSCLTNCKPLLLLAFVLNKARFYLHFKMSPPLSFSLVSHQYDN